MNKWAALVIALWASWLAIRLQPHVLGDDAAITMRYAQRAAAGRGLTYNDHERVLGASNPLYALGLAAVVRVGFDLETAVRVSGVVWVVLAALLAAQLSARLSGSALGLVAGGVLPLSFSQPLSPKL